MKMDARFWAAQIVFQVIFGLAIFGITRAIYVKDLSPPTVRSESAPSVRSQARAPAPAPAPQPAPSLSLSQEDPVRLGELADEWFGIGDYARAAEAYASLAHLDPTNPEHYNNLGISQHYLGQPQEALATLRKGTGYADDYPRLWLTLGFVQARQGLYDDARASFGQAIGIAPESDIAAEAQRMLQQLP